MRPAPGPHEVTRRENPLAHDLDHILTQTEGLWEDLKGERLFITGGTGFFGAWLLESFAWANERLGLDASAVVLSRDPDAFRTKCPHLSENPSIQFVRGDVRDFDFPGGEFSHIIHAATTSAVATFKGEDPVAKFDTVVAGTRRTLDFATACHARRLLLTSSGAVYGKQPSDMNHLTEEYRGAPGPADANAALGEGKRAAELLCTLYSSKYGIEAKIARCFSFVGPYLPLNIHYAIGNFIRDGLSGGPIQVKGDGTPCRSYLYATDLMIWLWTILFQGQACRPYNVGSEAGLSIGDLARMVADCSTSHPTVSIALEGLPGKLPDRYVPSTLRAQSELGLGVSVDLADAIRRTLEWNITITTYIR